MISGPQFKRARDAVNLTQQEAASRLGVSLRTIGNWERSEVIPAKHWTAIRHLLPELQAEEEGLHLDSDIEQRNEARAYVSTLGRRLQKYRAEEGYTVEEVAEVSELSAAVINAIESGKRSDVYVGEIFSLAHALRVPPAALLFDIEHPFQSYSENPHPDLFSRQFASSVLENLDWFSGILSEGSNDELEAFERDLQVNGPLYMEPVGLIFEPTWSPAGQRAVDLLRMAREVAALRAQLADDEYYVRSHANDVWPYRSNMARRDALDEAFKTGASIESPVVADLIPDLQEKDRDEVVRVLQEIDEARKELTALEDRILAAGGDPTPGRGQMSRRETMRFAERMRVQRFRDFLESLGVQEDPEREQARQSQLESLERMTARYREQLGLESDVDVALDSRD